MKQFSRIRTLSLMATTVAFLFLLTLGVAVAWRRAPFSFGFGDNALFHAAGMWIASGEMYIKDFIHFRTPGAYYFYSWIQQIFGSTFRSTSFAILLETNVVQPACTFGLALAATRVLLGRASYLISIGSVVCFFFLIPIFQLRTAFPAAAMAPYLMTLLPEDELSDAARRFFLVLTGLLLGLAYWAGEETFLFACWAILVADAMFSGRQITILARRLALIALAGSIVIVPPLLWLWAKGVSPIDYLYYTSWYAFVIQPSGLNIPFPALTFATLSFYTPFALLVGATAIFCLSGALGRPAGVALLSLACLRMISALGRSDTLHVAFSISELPVVLPVALAMLPRVQLKGLAKAIATAGLVLLVFVAGMAMKSLYVFAIPLILAALGRGTSAAGQPNQTASWAPIVATPLSLVVLFAIQYPDSYNFAHQNLDVLRTTPSTEFSGIQFNSTNRAELIDAQQYIKNNHINTLFAFPLIPEFYSFVRSHPTRVVYFEPEIQRQELTETAAELQKNPPQLIVQELGQTLGLSPVLYPLDDYISSHYDTTQYIHSGRVIELRTMKPTPQVTRRLMDRAYVSNPGRDSELSVDLQSVGTPVAPALVLTALKPIRFDFEPGPETTLRLSLLSVDAGSATTANVTITQQARVQTVQVHVKDGTVNIPLQNNGEPFSVMLYPAVDGAPSHWLNPMIVQ